MIKWIFIIPVLAFAISCKNARQESRDDIVTLKEEAKFRQEIYSFKDSVPTYDFDHLSPLFDQDDDKVHVINFWATWCEPCLDEMPNFLKLNEIYQDDWDLTLVSLDLRNQVNSRLKPFVESRNIEDLVIWLDDPKENEWIPKVDKNWSGALPATLIYRGDSRRFYEEAFSYEKLKEEVEYFMSL